MNWRMGKGLRAVLWMGAASLLLLSALALSGYLISRAADVHIVLRSSQPRVALRDAEQTLESGQVARAVPQFARAAAMVVDSSIRWRIADSYIRQSEAEFRAREIDEAFDACTAASQVLRSYDGGDKIEADCWELHMLLIRQEH